MRWVKIAVVALLAAFLLAAPSLLNSFYLRVVAEIMIYGLLAMAVNIMSGYTGLAPFGQAGIFGVAAYMVGFLVVKAGALLQLTGDIIFVAVHYQLSVNKAFHGTPAGPCFRLRR